MSNDLFYGSVEDFETSIQQKIDQQRAGRKEVSDLHYGALLIAMVSIVGCLAAQNALYGRSQGSTYSAMVLLSLLYFSGDWALAALSSIDARLSNVRFLSVVAQVGLILLSVSAGVAFMLSQQHETDIKASRISSLESDIRANQTAFELYHKTVTAERLSALRADLELERSRVGADHASTNALYVYLAKFSGYSFEAVSFTVRTLWIVVFILAGMTLSALLRALWCPWKEGRAYRAALKAEKARLKRLQSQVSLLHTYESIQQHKGAPTRKQGSTRAPTQDTKVQGKHSARYRQIRGEVQRGSIKPTVAALKGLGMGTATAQRYLRQLHAEGY